PGPPQPGTRQAKAAHAISCLAVHLFLTPFCQKAAGVSKEKRAVDWFSPTDQIGVAKMFRVSLIGLVSFCAKDDEGRCEGRTAALVRALSNAFPIQSRHAL